MTENQGHTQKGTNYGKETANNYGKTTHIPDKQRFLSGLIETSLADLAVGSKVIDIGTGTAPWAIFTAKHQAVSVTAIDYQPEMVTQAQQIVSEAGLSNKIQVEQGDAAALNSDSEIYDLALSIQVGCNLPQSSFPQHIKELTRVLKTNGKALITAPDSFGTIFYGGQESEDEILIKIKETLAKANENINLDAKTIQKYLSELSSINLATFAIRKGKLVFINDENTLQAGEEIWRKIPGGLTVPNYYHSVDQYKNEFKRNGLCIVKEYHSKFSSEDERNEFNQNLPMEKQLSQAYTEKTPFTIWILQKQ